MEAVFRTFARRLNFKQKREKQPPLICPTIHPSPQNPKATKNTIDKNRFAFFSWIRRGYNIPLKTYKSNVFLIHSTLSPFHNHQDNRIWLNHEDKSIWLVWFISWVKRGTAPLEPWQVRSFWFFLPHCLVGVQHHPPFNPGASLTAPRPPKVPLR